MHPPATCVHLAATDSALPTLSSLPPQMHFAPDPTAHGGATFRDRSVRGGKALAAAERSVHGGHEGSRHGGDRSFGGLASAALAAVRLDRSVHGGDRSVRGADRSSRGGDRSSRASRAEGSRHGSDLNSYKGMTLAAMSAARQDRSAHGGDPSVRGMSRAASGMLADRSVHALHRVGSGMLADRSVRSASQ